MSPADDFEFEFTFANVRPHSAVAPLEEPRGHYLVFIEVGQDGTMTEVGTEALTIGRDPKQSLVFSDSELSRIHARVQVVDGEVLVEDLRSTNGTYVDGIRIAGPTPLREGGTLRVGRQSFRYERLGRADAERAQELRRDLQRANSYVQALLPVPLATGPVRVDWTFLPSTQLGGDGFGYDWLDDDTFVCYLIDVSGHGVGAAMHSVAVLNLLRQRAMPQVDFADPGAVLSSLNDRFQMDQHDGMFFTIWYGVYRRAAGTLTYSSAGHHASYLVPADRSGASPLAVPDLMIGAVPAMVYEVRSTTVPAGSTLYLFSDGVFEIVTGEQAQLGLPDFAALLLEPPVSPVTEPERLYQRVRERARPGPLDDDFTLLALAFA